jgi:hypothetical protein
MPQKLNKARIHYASVVSEIKSYFCGHNSFGRDHCRIMNLQALLDPSKTSIHTVSMMNVQLYVAALTLNNIGIQLMELGSRPKALKTIMDSLKAFSLAMGPPSATSTSAVEAKVQNAFKRLSEQRASAEDSSTENSPLHGQFSGLHLTRIGLPESGAVAGRVAARSDHELHAAIVIRNAALSFYLLSKDFPKNSPAHASLIENAYKMLHLAEEVVCKQFAIVSDEDSLNELRLYTVASALVATMMRIYSDTGRTVEAKALEVKHTRLEYIICQYQNCGARPIASE